MSRQPESVPHGVPVALVAVTDTAWLDAAREFLLSRGQHLLGGELPAQALESVRANRADLVLVEAGTGFGPVFVEVAGRPGLARRNTCLVALGPFVSLDEYQAFRLGADWVLALADAPRAPELLAEILSRHQARQAPWSEALAKTRG